MRLAVCDDDRKEQECLVQAIQSLNPGQTVECFLNGASLLDAAKSLLPFNIVFLDIYMPGENGVDIARSLQTISPETKVVFVTTSMDHAVDAFSLNALHYLVKPVTSEDVSEVFSRLAALRPGHKEKISFSVRRESYTFYLDEICSLESIKHAVEVSLTDGRRLKVWMSLKEFEKKLDKRFMKVNRGTVVNMDHIKQMGIDTCILQDGRQFAITKRECPAIRAFYEDYLLSQFSQRGNWR